MSNSWRKRDPGITIRIIVCLSILAFLYIVFITVLAYLGLGYLPIILISAAFILSQWYFSDKIVLWSTRAKIVTRDEYVNLHTLVEQIALVNRMPKPKIAIVNSNIPNAFATGKGHRSSVVAVTTGLLNLLDHDELEGVIAHELTHCTTIVTISSCSIHTSKKS